MTVPATAPAASDPYAAINAAGKAGTSATTSNTVDSQDRFLKLLVTQLQNQDPLNPMDNAQMTSQLAQMSTVSGIEKLNTTLSSLVDGLGENQSMQAASMIGKSVLVAGSQLALTKGAAFAGVKLGAAADEVTLTIMDSSGKVVQTQKLGEHDAGIFNIAWDGKTDAGTTAPDGIYKFSVAAVSGSAKVDVSALQLGTVSALVRSKDGFMLDLGALGTVNFKDVQQIL
jgi:flagellar basal-body rod modification protein FlgD